MLICCITVKFPDGHFKTYERPLSKGSLSYAIQVSKVSVAHMRKSLEIAGAKTKVLGGWIRS